MEPPAGWVNTKQLHRIDPPLAVEHLIYEVRTEVFDHWREVEFEMWTKGEADRFPGFVGKETWVMDLGEWRRVSIVIYWRTLDDWLTIDPAWLDAHEAEFQRRVGEGNVRLVGAGHDAGAHYFKISEYR